MGNIVLYHVGGGELGMGPIDKVWNELPNVEVVLFEINDPGAPKVSQSAMQVQSSKYGKHNVPITRVNTCVYITDEEKNFYINKQEASSSLFPPAPESLGEYVYYGGTKIRSWKENTELDRIIKVKTESLDDIISRYSLPHPDILSIDAQGAELGIMTGGINTITNDVICVQSEMEFSPIYNNQPLFHDQCSFLHKHNFRLMDIYSQQWWDQGPKTVGRMNIGLLTVSECIFIRNYDLEKFSFDKLLKLAEIAYVFDRLSFSDKILGQLYTRFPGQLDAIRNEPRYKDMIDTYHAAKL